jgi:hypothetical protein
LPISKKRFTSYESLRKTPPIGDVYLTGSDQVWNSTYNKCVDKAHFLDFAPLGKTRIAYAASFGKDCLLAQEMDDIRSLLNKYSMISVRESSGAEIINSLGIPNAQLVLDPTLLLSSADWAQEFHFNKPAQKRYLLIYSVERDLDEIVYTVAKRIADALGLYIIFLTQAAWKRSMRGCHKELFFSKVIDFIRYLFYADFVVASSFHGTAFAINFNKQFVSVLPNKYGGRQRSLLNLIGLNDRIIEKKVEMNKIIKNINYANVNKILGQERIKSLAYFEAALNHTFCKNDADKQY